MFFRPYIIINNKCIHNNIIITIYCTNFTQMSCKWILEWQVALLLSVGPTNTMPGPWPGLLPCHCMKYSLLPWGGGNHSYLGGGGKPLLPWGGGKPLLPWGGQTTLTLGGGGQTTLSAQTIVPSNFWTYNRHNLP